ncbi:MAG: hypothetical protein MZV65_35640 [Chromatiales bacterium]|nr:hypothetical protein [Chromatiales bacterium]
MAERRSRRPRASEANATARVDGWAEHEESQRRAWQATTPRQRLEWLEEAKRFAKRAQEAAKRRSE